MKTFKENSNEYTTLSFRLSVSIIIDTMLNFDTDLDGDITVRVNRPLSSAYQFHDQLNKAWLPRVTQAWDLSCSSVLFRQCVIHTVMVKTTAIRGRRCDTDCDDSLKD